MPEPQYDGIPQYDVIIVGAGLVGAACALALKGSGLRVALAEGRAPLPLPDDESWDSRIYAISPASATFLTELGIWNHLPAGRIQPVEAMHIVGDNGVAGLDFGAYESGVSELAFIAESRVMQSALWHALENSAEVTLLCPAQCSTLSVGNDGASLTLADGRFMTARLIVGADGAQSWVRQQVGMQASDKDYRQLGVVANFAAAKSHQGVARQWFRPDGILAYLPLPGNRVSIVWSTDTVHGEALLAASPEALCAEVAQAGQDALGELTLLTPPAAFPLHLIEVERIIGPRVALIGDAAHQLHPLAGQGVNLGFGDARALAETLKARGHRECGDPFLLRRYERARKEQIIAMQSVTDALKELFGKSSSVVGAVRNLGLSLTNRAGWLKQRLIQHAMS
jgi:ubiquinone biosynthesis UbiH/UbiF/VisC/COQ6 family hydroxylase